MGPVRPQTPQLRAKALNNPNIDRVIRGQKWVQGTALTRGLGASSPQRLFLCRLGFVDHGGGDALMMDYVCELIAAGGAEGLTSVDASVESHVMALAAEHSRTHGGSAVELAEFTEK